MQIALTHKGQAALWVTNGCTSISKPIYYIVYAQTIKCSSKANIASSKHCLLYNSQVTTHCQIYDKTQNSIWSKAFIMLLTILNFVFCLTNRRIISVKVGLIFQEIALITEFPGCKFLQSTFLTGGKLDFQVANLVANLLLAIVNFEP